MAVDQLETRDTAEGRRPATHRCSELSGVYGQICDATNLKRSMKWEFEVKRL